MRYIPYPHKKQITLFLYLRLSTEFQFLMLELPATLANCTTTYFHHHIQGRSHKIHLCSRSANCHWALHYLSTCDSISSAYGWTSKTGRLWPSLFPCILLYTPQHGFRCCPVGLDRLCSLPRHTLGMSKKAKLSLLNLINSTLHCRPTCLIIWSIYGKIIFLLTRSCRRWKEQK